MAVVYSRGVDFVAEQSWVSFPFNGNETEDSGARFN